MPHKATNAEIVKNTRLTLTAVFWFRDNHVAP